MLKVTSSENLSKEPNYGIKLLKMFMCFEVICCHFWKMETVRTLHKPFIIYLYCAVPVFMFLSFLLCYRTITAPSPSKLYKRCWKLFSPLLFWGIIYWIVYNTFFHLYANTSFVGLDTLILQILFGHTLNASMWFQFNIIFLTLLFSTIFMYYRGSKGLFVTIFLFFIALIAQYSGLNWRIFHALPSSVNYSLGRIAEMVPYAALALVIAHFRILEKLKQHCIITIILCTTFSAALFYTNIHYPIPVPMGFSYAGLYLLILTFLISTAAYLLPLHLLPSPIKIFINLITKYTLGIYCMHRLVGEFLIIFLEKYHIEIDSFFLCTIIYLLSFLIALLLDCSTKHRLTLILE